MNFRAPWVRPLLQVVVVSAALVFLIRTTRGYWPTVAHTHMAGDWPALIAASVVWYVSFFQLVHAWTGSLSWFQEGTGRVSWLNGLRMFLFSNLARYIPGGIWQFAGLASLATSAGVSPLSATAAALWLQLWLLITGTVIALATMSPERAALAIAAGVVLVAVTPRVLDALRTTRLFRRVPLPRVSIPSLARFTAQAVLAWIGYGCSFWLFARGVLGSTIPGVVPMAGAYIASYVAGILAIFAPGGLVVREAALVVALRSTLGPDRALFLALASRLWLVALEIVGGSVLLAADTIASRVRRPV